jgi:hypothetical protein
VTFPFLLPVIKSLTKLPPNPIFDFIFRLYYAYRSYMTGEMDLGDFIRLGLHARSSFGRGNWFGAQSH